MNIQITGLPNQKIKSINFNIVFDDSDTHETTVDVVPVLSNVKNASNQPETKSISVGQIDSLIDKSGEQEAIVPIDIDISKREAKIDPDMLTGEF